MNIPSKTRISFIQFGFIFLLIWLTSCSNNEEPRQDSSNYERIEKILTEMKSIGDSEGKIVKFDLKNLMDKNYQKHFKVIHNSKKVMDFNLGKDSKDVLYKDNYTVTCTWGDGSTTVTECGDDVACAGAATWDCLDNGGCATVCNANIRYIPSKLL